MRVAHEASSRPCSLSPLASVPGISGIKWKEATRVPASVDCFSGGRGHFRETPPPAGYRTAAGTKAACLGGAAGGVAPGPGLPSGAPTRPSSAARCAPEVSAAGLLLARQRRAGSEQCERAAPEGRGEVHRESSPPESGSGWGAASSEAPGARGASLPTPRAIIADTAAPAPGVRPGRPARGPRARPRRRPLVRAPGRARARRRRRRRPTGGGAAAPAEPWTKLPSRRRRAEGRRAAALSRGAHCGRCGRRGHPAQ